MGILKVSTAITEKIGPFLDSTDGVASEAALTVSQGDVRLSKNGGDFAQKTNASSCTHDEKGYYDCPLSVTDTGTPGRLKLVVHESGALPIWHDYMVVPANVYDSLFGADKLQVHAAEITAALIKASTIATGAITVTKLATGAIANSKLATGAISATKIATAAIGATQLAADVITADKVAADAITAGNLAAGAIAASTIAADAITADKIAADAITAGNFAARAIQASTIATGAITTTKLATGAISATKIATGAVGATQIADDAITADKIAADSITAGNFAAGAIAASTIAADAITADKIAADAITAGNFAARAIQASTIATGAITTTKLATGAISATKIATGAIGATQLADDAITNDKMAADTITAGVFAAGAIAASTLAADVITADKIAADTITAGNFAARAIQASTIATGAITTTKLATGAISATKIATAAIGATQIAGDAITADKLAADTITAGNFKAGAIAASTIAADAITVTKIADNAISASKIATNAITASAIATDAIASAAFADSAKAVIQAEAEEALEAKHLDHLISVVGTVSDAAPAAFDFDTDLSEASDDHYNGSVITFIDGPLAGQSRRVWNYSGSSKNIQVLPLFTEAPANGNSFVILTIHDRVRDIVQVIPSIPPAIDLSNTALVRLGLLVRDELYNAFGIGDITPGTIDILRKAIGGTSWSTVVSGVTCEEATGTIYYDEVFDSGSYAVGDMLLIIFKHQAVTADGHTYYIDPTAGGMGMRFYTHIRETPSTALETYNLDHLLAVADNDDVVDDSALAKLAAKGATADWSTFDNTTDSQEAIRDNQTTGADESVLIDTTIATLSSQTSFTLTAGSGDDDAYNNQAILIIDQADSNQISVRKVSDYTGSGKTITLDSAPDYTIAVGDTAKIFATAPGTTAPTVDQVADQVWDEAKADHTTADTFGEECQSIRTRHYPNE